jgi:hypothetical protein
MIFYEKFENRIDFWRQFRENLEVDSDPIQRTIDFWNTAPISAMSCDPFDRDTWLGAWQLIDENKYCDFGKILAIYYTLSLTDRFKNSFYEIQVAADKKEQKLYYILIMDDKVIGYNYNRATERSEVPKLWIQNSHVMTDHLE